VVRDLQGFDGALLHVPRAVVDARPSMESAPEPAEV
jgi:hypothetical protein